MPVDRNNYPPGWDLERVQATIAYYEGQTDQEAEAEFEAGLLHPDTYDGMMVPNVLRTFIGRLIDGYEIERDRMQDAQDSMADADFERAAIAAITAMLSPVSPS